MIAISEEQKELIIKYLPDIEEVLMTDNVNEILLPLDDFITENCFDKDYELTDLGLKLQKAYDEIFNQND